MPVLTVTRQAPTLAFLEETVDLVSRGYSNHNALTFAISDAQLAALTPLLDDLTADGKLSWASGSGGGGSGAVNSVTSTSPEIVISPTVGDVVITADLSGYVAATRAINTTAPLAGGGDLSADRTLFIDANGITNALFRQSAGLSVVGRSANTLGNVADIVAGVDGDVFRRSGTTLGFGAIPQSSVTNLVTDLATITTSISTLAADVITEVIAGSGLTGGGSSGSVTLNIGAGTGILVNADSIEVDPSVVFLNSDITVTTNTLAMGGPSDTLVDSPVSDDGTTLYSTRSTRVARGTWGNGALQIDGTSFSSHFNYGADEDTYLRGGKAASVVRIGDVNAGVVVTPATTFQGAVGIVSDLTVNGNVAIGNAGADAHAVLGTVNFNATAGSNGQILGVSGGVPVWGAPSAFSVVDGTGTLNTIAMWTPDGNTLGNSPVTDDGTYIATSRRGWFSKDVNSFLQVGYTYVNTTDGQNSIAFLTDGGDGNVYIATKGASTKGLVFTIGQGTEAASTRTWLTVTGSTGAAAFASNVTLGDAVTDAHTINGLVVLNPSSGVSDTALNINGAPGYQILFSGDTSPVINSWNASATQLTFRNTGGGGHSVLVVGDLAITGNATLGDATTDNHTISGRTTGSTTGFADGLTWTNTATAGAYTMTAGGFTATGTLDATASDRYAFGLSGIASTTRSAGANAVINLGLFGSASGGQLNRAIQTNEGDVYFHAVSGSTTIAGPTQIGTSSGHAHTLVGTLNANGTAGSNGQILGVTGGLPQWGAPSTFGVVDGTGTLNYLPKWTPDGNTLGNSMVVDDGDQVTITTGATSAPFTGLKVLSGDAGTYEAIGVGRTSVDLHMAVSGGVNHYQTGTAQGDSIIIASSGKLFLSTRPVDTGTNRGLTIDTSGNVTASSNLTTLGGFVHNEAPAATQVEYTLTQAGQGTWYLYMPASDPDFKLYSTAIGGVITYWDTATRAIEHFGPIHNAYDGGAMYLGTTAAEQPKIGWRASDDSERFRIHMQGVNTSTERLAFFKTVAGEIEVFSVEAAGHVGINNASPSTSLHVNAEVIDDNAFAYDTNAIMVVHQTPTATATLNDPKNVLMLARQGTSGQAFGAAAAFNLSRYENSGVSSRTRLDLTLAHNSFDPTSNPATTWLSSGQVFLGDTTYTSISSNVDVLTIGNSGAGQTADAKALMQMSYTGSMDTTAAPLSANGLFLQMSGTRSAGGNAFEQYGLRSQITGGQSANYGLYVAVSGAASNYAIYAGGGTIYSVGNLIIDGNTTLGNATSDTVAISGNATISGGVTTLNNGTSNWIDYGQNGVAAPTFTTRSAGTKVVLYSAVAGATVDGAIGIEGSTVWFSTFDVSSLFKWYAGTTNVMTLSGAGVLNVAGSITENGTPVLSGSISDNYITKGSSGNLVNSSIVDNGTTVDVGLHMTGQRSGDTWWSIKPSQTNHHLRLAGNGSGGVRFNYDGSSTNGVTFYDGSSNQVAFITSNGSATFGVPAFGTGGTLVAVGNATLGSNASGAAVGTHTMYGSLTQLHQPTGASGATSHGVELRPHGPPSGDFYTAVDGSVTAGAGFNTTTQAIRATGGRFFSSSSRTAGANNLTNVGVLCGASNGQINYAIWSGDGDVLLNDSGGVLTAQRGVTLNNTSGTTLIKGATTLNSTLNVTSATTTLSTAAITTANITTGNVTTLAVSGNATLGDASGDTHTLNGNLTFSNTPTAGPVKYGSANARMLIGTRRYAIADTGSTYTPTTGTKAIRLRMVGGGGGSAGLAGLGSSLDVSGGGASGAYAEWWLDAAGDITSSGTVTVGAAGTGGVAGGAAGNSGGDTSITINGTLFTAKSGTGANRSGTGSTNRQASGGAINSGTGANASGTFASLVPLAIAGAPGIYATRYSLSFCIGGNGGSNPLGEGGRGVETGNSSGGAANGYGGGGGGGMSSNLNITGINGTAGVILIEEYA